jgi:hypothetical protein
MLTGVVAGVSIFIAAIFAGGEYVNGGIFSNRDECIATVEYVKQVMSPEEVALYQWVECEEVAVHLTESK